MEREDILLLVGAAFALGFSCGCFLWGYMT